MDNVENDFEKEKLVNLGRFVNFLKWFDENLKNYRKLSISYEIMDRETGVVNRGKTIEFVGDDIKDNSYAICDTMVKYTKCEIVGYFDEEKFISFHFVDNSNIDSLKFIYITCFKKEIYK